MAVSYNNFQNRIGTNCCFHRRLQGLYISELAEKSGLTSETIRAIEEYTKETVTTAEVKALANAFGISQDRLFDACPKAEDSERIAKKKANNLSENVKSREKGGEKTMEFNKSDGIYVLNIQKLFDICAKRGIDGLKLVKVKDGLYKVMRNDEFCVAGNFAEVKEWLYMLAEKLRVVEEKSGSIKGRDMSRKLNHLENKNEQFQAGKRMSEILKELKD